MEVFQDEFFVLFEPWEIEELFCVYTFTKAKYNQIFDDIAWDVDEKNPKFDGQCPPDPVGAFNLDCDYTREHLLEGTIFSGLHLLHTVLFTIENHNHLVSTMQEKMLWARGTFLEETFYDRHQDDFRSHIFVRVTPPPLLERDRKEQRRDPLPFRGDQVLDPTGVHPPLSWTIMRRGTYSNLRGIYIPENMRLRGYTVWDTTRLEQTRADKVLQRQWGDGDPRDTVHY
ncbi:hypothetical protein BJX99DRAFT_257149 [Aspergillus californicus]